MLRQGGKESPDGIFITEGGHRDSRKLQTFFSLRGPFRHCDKAHQGVILHLVFRGSLTGGFIEGEGIRSSMDFVFGAYVLPEQIPAQR